MKLIFANEQISEFKDGEFHAKNNGKPIEVNADLGARFLQRTAVVGGEHVPVFEKYEEKSESKAETKVKKEK